MRPILAGVLAGIVVSVLVLIAIVSALPAGPILQRTPPAPPTLPLASPPVLGISPSPTTVPLNSSSASSSATAGAGLELGGQGPPLAVSKLGGGRIDRAQLVGKPVWVNFTATWCATCRDDLALLQRFQTALGSRITIVVIDVREPPELMSTLVRNLGLTLPVGLDDGTAQRDWAAYVLPVNYWLDADGRVQGFLYGGGAPDVFLDSVRKVVPDAKVDFGQ